MGDEKNDDLIDLKVKFDYNGQQRCALIDVMYSELYSMDFLTFSEFLTREIPQLQRISVLRISFLDEEQTYIDLTKRNFHRFLRLSTHTFKSATPKINLLVQEGSSPLVKTPRAKTSVPESFTTKRSLFDPDETKKEFEYKSPVELEIDLKSREVKKKEAEVIEVSRMYDLKYREFNPVPNGLSDPSKTLCTRCHLRLGHSKNRYRFDFAF